MDFRAAVKKVRMRQDLERLRRLATPKPRYRSPGEPPGIPTWDAKHAAHDFFIHCHAFKDWLAKEQPHLRDAIEAHVTKSPALSLAADWANAEKHGGLDRRPRASQQIDSVKQATEMVTVDGVCLFSARAIYYLDGVEHQVLELAERCLRDWDAFLGEHGIVLK